MAFTIHFYHVTAKLTIDKAGRIVIPKPLRDRMHLSPGDSLDLQSTDDQITLRPVRQRSSMYKKDGAWLISTGKGLSVEDVNAVIQSVRDERDLQNMGPLAK